MTSKEQQHTNNEHEQYYLTKTRGNYRTPETVHEQRATDKSINKTPTHMARTKCDEQNTMDQRTQEQMTHDKPKIKEHNML